MKKNDLNKIAFVFIQLALTVSFGFGRNITVSSKDTTHFVGEKFGGGIVFYVYDNGRHGLIAAASDQSFEIAWSNGANKLTGTSQDGMNNGAKNTDSIIAAQTPDNQKGNFAAKICADFSIIVNGKTYDDWYLPSKYELDLLYLQNTVVGGFDGYYYWSSNEVDSKTAWVENFYDGRQLEVSKGDTNYVRAIRAF